MTEADAEIVRKAQRILAVLRPEQKMARELEVLAALRTVLTEPELSRLIVLGLEALAMAGPDDRD